MNDHVIQPLVLSIARVVALVFAVVLAYGAVMYWGSSQQRWRLIGMISLVALLTFALLPRKYLTLPAVRQGIFILAGVATAANMFGLVHSINNFAYIGVKPILFQLLVAILFVAMFIEAYLRDRKHVAI
jgi:hypothetical protein